MHRIQRTTIFYTLIAAMIGVVAIAGVATAASTTATTAKKKKKPLFTAKQTKQINKLIDAKIAQIPKPVEPVAYTASNAAQVNIVSDLNTNQHILSKSIPAGKYVVTGRVNGFDLTDNGSDESNMVCTASLNGTTVQTAQASNDAGIFLFAASGASLDMSFDFAIDATAASTLALDCSGGYDSPGALAGEYVGAGQGTLTAVTVKSIG